MNSKKLPDLSKAEYGILRILWKGDCRSVREVHDRIHDTMGWAYTTTKTMMDRMVQKGLLSREEFHGVFLYRPLISRPAGLANLVKFSNGGTEDDASTKSGTPTGLVTFSAS